MPQTVPMGFEFENLGEEPTRTLNGGSDGLSPIVAQQVNDAFVDVLADLADLTGRVAALEDTAADTPWRRIDSGTFSGHAFSIAVPAATYSILRLHLHGDLDAEGDVQVRVNSDTTAGLHRSGRIVWDALGNQDVTGWGEDTAWAIADWGTLDHQSAELTIYRAATNDQQTFHCIGGRSATTASGHRVTLAWGELANNRALTSLQIFSSSGTDFSNLHWWLEGFLA